MHRPQASSASRPNQRRRGDGWRGVLRPEAALRAGFFRAARLPGDFPLPPLAALFFRLMDGRAADQGPTVMEWDDGGSADDNSRAFIDNASNDFGQACKDHALQPEAVILTSRAGRPPWALSDTEASQRTLPP